MNSAIEYLRIKTLTAPKTSLNAQGGITYAVLKGVDTQEVYFCLLANEGGGYFSREAVPFNRVQRCLKDTKVDQPIPAKTFRDAFVGRSANNAGFLVAALRHEGLLLPAPDAPHQHVMGGDWADWKASVLADGGEPFILPDAKKIEPEPVAPAIVEGTPVKGAAGKKEKKSKPVTVAVVAEDPEEADHACSA
ncbi:hypothetical protein [Propionivibrio sp.]|uniref:hypothetical protein n=1 Tax=Propionivibrio sp. TaxID=2212460 RepID=UPI003BF3368F